jgi:hypothetical protein
VTNTNILISRIETVNDNWRPLRVEGRIIAPRGDGDYPVNEFALVWPREWHDAQDDLSRRGFMNMVIAYRVEKDGTRVTLMRESDVTEAVAKSRNPHALANRARITRA